MPDIPRTKFNSPWTVTNIEAALNDVSSAKGSSESLTAALNAMRAEINSLSGGVHLKGAVDYYSDLPASPSEGDAYTVRYQGTSGTDPLGIEYAWATYQGTPQWIPIGVDPSVFAKQAEMDVVANAGAKNLLSVNDGSGTNVTMLSQSGIIKSGNYVMTFKASGFSGNYALSFYDANGALISAGSLNGAIAADKSVSFTLGQDAYTVKFFILGTATISELMLRPAAITDATFQPYAKTNRELTVITDEDRAALVELVDGGAKSLLNPEDTVSNKSLRGVTVTRTGDVYSFSGTAEDNSNIFININNDTTINNLPAGDYVAVFEQAQQDIKLQVGINGTIIYTGEFGQPLFFSVPSTATSNWIRFFFVRLVNYNGKSSRIMICTAAAYAVSSKFVPYRPRWQEMWDAIQAIQNGGNRALTMQMQPTESTEPEQEER